MSGKDKKPEKGAGSSKKGVDPKKIKLDKSGKFELDPSQLDKVSGGMRDIEVIRGSKCGPEPTVDANKCKVIRGSVCSPS
jgi:hypothetical protein